MASSAWHGGPYVEVFSAQGSKSEVRAVHIHQPTDTNDSVDTYLHYTAHYFCLSMCMCVHIFIIFIHVFACMNVYV